MSQGQAQADWRAACLMSGRYDLLVEEYDFPLTVWLPGQPAMVATPRTAWGFFQAFHAALVAAGFARLSAQVVAEGLARAGRRRLWTDWWGAGAGQGRTLVAQTICYCRAAPNDQRTEMLEFTRLDLPALATA